MSETCEGTDCHDLIHASVEGDLPCDLEIDVQECAENDSTEKGLSEINQGPRDKKVDGQAIDLVQLIEVPCKPSQETSSCRDL